MKNVCSFDHKALYMCLKRCAPPYLESFAQQYEYMRSKDAISYSAMQGNS